MALEGEVLEGEDPEVHSDPPAGIIVITVDTVMVLTMVVGIMVVAITGIEGDQALEFSL